MINDSSSDNSVKYQLEWGYYFKHSSGRRDRTIKLEGEWLFILYRLRYNLNKLENGEITIVDEVDDEDNRYRDKEEEIKKHLRDDIKVTELLTTPVSHGEARIMFHPSGFNASTRYCPQQQVETYTYHRPPSPDTCRIS